MSTLLQGMKAMSCVFSGEWLLTRARGNGGTVIVGRSVWVAGWVCTFGLAAYNLLDPERGSQFSSVELRRQIIVAAQWFGTIFAGAYTALYARFASQWAYLAGVYNQIKATECILVRAPDSVPMQSLVEWKAGFIEDAEELHLAMKPLFASIIRVWARDPAVEGAYAQHVQDGTNRLNTLLRRIA